MPNQPSSDAARPETEALIDIRTAADLDRLQEAAMFEIRSLSRMIDIQVRRLGGEPLTPEDGEFVIRYFDRAHVTKMTLWVIRTFPDQWDAWVSNRA